MIFNERRRKSLPIVRSSSSTCISFIAWLLAQGEKKCLSLCVLWREQPMKKWSAQPTGNGQRKIIIITTLLLFLRTSASSTRKKKKKKKRKASRKIVFSILFPFFVVLLCKKETKTHSPIQIYLIGDSYTLAEKTSLSCTLYFSSR